MPRLGRETGALPGLTVELEGVGPMLFEKSRRARRVSVTIRSSLGVRVAVPTRVSFEEARRLAAAKRFWIRRTLARVERARGRCREAVLAAGQLDKRSARALLERRLEELAAEHGFICPGLSVRTQSTLWGSASPSGRVQLNAHLAVLPQELADYVIIHELVHTRVRGHGRAFWTELARHVADVRGCRARLREYSLALF
ncbi:MAG: YgjP-like metallopeptidase domain-containing protein [Candidatus Aminicenantales bacterium]